MQVPKRIALLLLLVLPQLSLAQEGFTTKSVSIFKNGTAFFVKDAEVKTDNGVYRMEEAVPQALFGTLWFNSAQSELRSVGSVLDTVSKPKQATSLLQMLKANPGRRAEIWLAEEDKPLTAKIEEVEKELIQFTAQDKWYSVGQNEIKRVAFLDKPNQKYEQKVPQRVINVDFQSEKPQQNLNLMYLEGNLGWLPNYNVELVSEDKAVVTLRAIVMNDAEDIENAEMNFVVGVPNFMYAGQMSPLVGAQTVSSFLGSLNSGSGRGVGAFDNSITIQSNISYGVEAPSTGDFFGSDELTSLDGSSQEDLYFYTKKKVSLKKGARAFYDILKVESPVEHIYEVQLKANNSSGNYYAGSFSFSENNLNKVFHSIKLANKSTQPWTTGTAMVIRKDEGQSKPISQDMMKFTPPKGETFLKLTVAPDVSVKDAEKEINRLESNKRKDGYAYDLVSVSGQIKIKNYKKKEIALNVRRSITGELTSSKPDWLEATRVNTRNALNKVNDVCWELTLKAGEEKVVNYEYKVFIRH